MTISGAKLRLEDCSETLNTNIFESSNYWIASLGWLYEVL